MSHGKIFFFLTISSIQTLTNKQNMSGRSQQRLAIISNKEIAYSVIQGKEKVKIITKGCDRTDTLPF